MADSPSLPSPSGNDCPSNGDSRPKWPISLWMSFLRAHRRFGFAVAVSLLTLLLVPARLGFVVRIVSAWDSGSLAMLALTWWIMIRSGPQKTRRRAASEDPGRTLIWLIVLASCGFSLLAATALINQAEHLANAPLRLLLVGLCLLAVASSWLLTHTAWALRYAHLYYRQDGAGEGGLSFPGEEPPDDLDFAYFAFTLGMCFQTSDVAVLSRTIRRYVLLHALVSFVYNTSIIALSINLASGLFGG